MASNWFIESLTYVWMPRPNTLIASSPTKIQVEILLIYSSRFALFTAIGYLSMERVMVFIAIAIKMMMLKYLFEQICPKKEKMLDFEYLLLDIFIVPLKAWTILPPTLLFFSRLLFFADFFWVKKNMEFHDGSSFFVWLIGDLPELIVWDVGIFGDAE